MWSDGIQKVCSSWEVSWGRAVVKKTEMRSEKQLFKHREGGNSTCNCEIWIGKAQHRDHRFEVFFKTGKSGKKSGEKMETIEEVE